MDNVQLQDLKQFIAATVSQATANMATKDDLAHAISGLATKQDIADLDLKLDTIAGSLHEDLQDHEQRITRLEQRVV